MPGAKHEQSLGFTAPIEIIQEGSGQDLPPLGRTPTRNEQRRRILAQGSRDVSAPTGFVNEGSFGLSGQWWNGDPFNGGGLIATATDVALPYSATMSGGSNSGTPEPAEVYFFVFGVALTATWRRSRLLCASWIPAFGKGARSEGTRHDGASYRLLMRL